MVNSCKVNFLPKLTKYQTIWQKSELLKLIFFLSVVLGYRNPIFNKLYFYL